MNEPTDADVLIVAGDIHRNTQAIGTFVEWHPPVIYVHGNHEAYKEQYFKLVENRRAISADSHVHYLGKNEYMLKV